MKILKSTVTKRVQSTGLKKTPRIISNTRVRIPIKDSILSVKTDFGIKTIYEFGKKDGNDIDLLIVIDTWDQWLRRNLIKRQLQNSLTVVHCVFKSREQFDKELRMPTSISKHAYKEGGLL